METTVTSNTGRHGKRGGCWPVPGSIVVLIALVLVGAGCELRSKKDKNNVTCVAVVESVTPTVPQRAPHLQTPPMETCAP